MKEDSKADKAADKKAGIKEGSKADTVSDKKPTPKKKRKIFGKY